MRGGITYNLVVVRSSELSDTEVDAIFGALADATRRDIIVRVMRHEQSVSSLAAHYSMSFAAVQKHVAVLERASLIHKQRSGREQIVHAVPQSIAQARSLLDQWEELWRHRAAQMERILAEGELERSES